MESLRIDRRAVQVARVVERHPDRVILEVPFRADFTWQVEPGVAFYTLVFVRPLGGDRVEVWDPFLIERLAASTEKDE